VTTTKPDTAPLTRPSTEGFFLSSHSVAIQLSPPVEAEICMCVCVCVRVCVQVSGVGSREAGGERPQQETGWMVIRGWMMMVMDANKRQDAMMDANKRQ
jgi:hypothetical protein